MADLEVVFTPEPMLVCPFRTITKLIPNNFGAADQIIEFPECQGRACPFYNDEADNNNERCFKTYSVMGG
jgi:hypothetical protein